jgi:DNA-binding CsgD family transcriptional regulator
VTGARELRVRTLAEVRAAIPFDFYAWVVTDPETTVGIDPLADVPGPVLAELPRLIRLKYLTEVNRWTALPTGVARLADVTGGDLARSRLWRELLAGHGVTDVASAVLRDRYGCWGFLDLWRRGGVFTRAEADALADLLGPLTTALRGGQAAAFPAVAGPIEPGSGPVALLLSPDLAVLGSTADTAPYLRTLLPPGPNASPVPACAYNVAAQLLAVEAGVDDHPPRARVHLSGGRWLNVRAARLDGGEAAPDRPIAVTLEDALPVERLGLFGRAYGFTPRERELLGHLAAGADTRHVARRMGLSEHTVTDHLKAMFTKAGTHGRSALVSRALGT